jgi:hypothetical protein
MRKHFLYFFTPGLQELKVSQTKEVRQRLIDLVSPGRKSTFYSYSIYGWRDIPHHMYLSITDLFREYGVEESKVWKVEEIKNGTGKGKS